MNPGIEIPKTQLEIFHKHSASLPVTFKNISGTVNLRLEVVAGQKAESGEDLKSGLKLDTTTLNVSGTAAMNIKISAPTVPGQVKTSTDAGLTAKYTLFVSQNGKDIASSIVTIQEKLLNVTSSFEPGTVTLVGGKAKATLVLKVSPPLDAPVEINADATIYISGSGVKLAPLGATYGNGGTMRRDYEVTGPGIIPAGITSTIDIVTTAQDFAGYRLPGYFTQSTDLKVTNPSAPAPEQPGIEIPKTRLEIFHKHSASLPVTFKNISGPVNLRLEVVAGQKAESGEDLESGLKLDTTTLNVSSTSSTKNIKISAPTVPGNVKTTTDAGLTARYTLFVSQNGKDIASSIVTIQEKLLDVTSSFEPGTVTLVGGKAKATLVLKVSPPLDAPVEINADDVTYNGAGSVRLTAAGATYGDGGTMRRDFQVTHPGFLPDGLITNITVVTLAQDFAGYRLPGYWTQKTKLKVIKPAP